MAETRKHQQVVRDALDQAIVAALGESVRPFTPGEDPYVSRPDADGVRSDQGVTPGRLPTYAPLGTFTLSQLPSPDGAADAAEA